MGNCCPPSKAADENLQVISEIGSEDDEANINESIKFMLLGAGESGKTTLFKQMKINYVATYSQQDLTDERDRIILALLAAFRDYLDAIRAHYNVESKDIEVQETGSRLFPQMEADNVTNPPDPNRLPKVIDEETAKFMQTIWTSEEGRQMWEDRANYKIIDSLSYFMNDLNRFADPAYDPTEMDYLKCRITTIGISEQTFVYKGVKIIVVDVGGQRSERHKWVACFHNLSAILFVASLSEFDQKLFEDMTADRLPEALALFAKMLRSPLLKRIPVVLFLNKQDLLAEKLRNMEARGDNLDDFFPELGLGTDYTNASQQVEEHLRGKFIAAVDESQRSRIMPHFITATDKGAFKTVFQTAATVVLREALKHHFTAEE